MTARSHTLAFAALGALAILAGGCASHERSQRESAQTLATIDTQDHRAAATEIKGETASAWGDNWTAANLFERAEAKHDSPLNRFNLAAVYQKTGRTREAVRLYDSVAVDGGNTWAYTVPDFDDHNTRVRRFNLAIEATDRLRLIDPDAHIGVEQGRNATRVTDQHAEALDSAAQPSKSEPKR
jgi:tetratricopeptide (TPR) repeat protein